MPYTTTANLKRYLGIASADDDLLLADCIKRAQAYIDTAIVRTFEAPADTTRFFDSEAIDGLDLHLDDDLCQITSVTNGDGVLVAAADYHGVSLNDPPWYRLRMKVGASARWTASPAHIAVVGRWAYTVTAPDDIVQATERMAAWIYRQKDNSFDSERAMIAGNATILPPTLPSDVRDYLYPYRRLVR